MYIRRYMGRDKIAINAGSGRGEENR